MPNLEALLLLVVFLGGALVPMENVEAREESVKTLSAPAPAQSNAPPRGDAKVAGAVSLMSNREFWLSVIILVFGMFIIVVEYFLLRDVVKDKTEEIAKTYTVTLIIIGTLVLISSGFTSQQIAPALGLFGTIAGYLLGRADLKQRRSQEARENERET